MKPVLKVVQVLLPFCLLTACSVVSQPPPAQLLTDMVEPWPAPPPASLAPASVSQVADAWDQVLALSPPSEVRLAVEARLATLALQVAEQKMAQGQLAGASLETAIAQLQKAVSVQPSAMLLYQLAKACEAAGRLDEAASTLEVLRARWPDSPWTPEAIFRIAEHRFSAGDYEDALAAYTEAMSGEGSSYRLIARYMAGWSHFKLADYASAAAAFVAVLEQLSADDHVTEGNAALRTDTRRITSIVLSRAGGPVTLHQLLGNTPDAEFIASVYQDLAAFYQDKARMNDAAETYQVYLRHHPLTPQTPVMHEALISTLGVAGYTEEVIEEKKQFVLRYSRYAAYQQQVGAAVPAVLDDLLEKHLRQLANHYDTLSTGGEVSAELQAVNQAEAADWYLTYVREFPELPSAAFHGFRAAELLEQTGRLQQARVLYEWVGYEAGESEFAADAAYSYFLLSAAASDETYTTQGLRFANRFDEDERTSGILLNISRRLFAAEAFDETAELCQRLLDRADLTTPLSADEGNRRRVMALLAQTRYGQRNFPAAEELFRHLLAASPDSAGQKDWRHKLAISVYQQARSLQAADNHSEAQARYEEVAATVPGSELAATAIYDLAGMLFSQQLYPLLPEVLIRFRTDWPSHPLQKEITHMLITAFVETGQWLSAGKETEALARNAPTDAASGLLWLKAADYYEKGADLQQTILAVRHYANHYDEGKAGFDKHLLPEAQFRLISLYSRQQDDYRASFWRRKLLATVSALTSPDDRARFLAGEVYYWYAEQARAEFGKVALVQPLGKSLKIRKQALDTTLAAYQKVIGTGSLQRYNEARYRIAQLYVSLAEDLLNSERPPELDAAALDEYNLLLEEQIWPFEQLATEMLEEIVTPGGHWDDWTASALTALAGLYPARYAKTETYLEVVGE
ncbi:MAG: tetratricopeptide repeat protein [Pseudomonadales bacterium]|nr:tetratricopeptide repeat protein [Pseudomonadales bacterium]